MSLPQVSPAIRHAAARLPMRLATGEPQCRRLAALRIPIHGQHKTPGPQRQDASALDPPAPPIRLTPLLACDETTSSEVLWHIARQAPELRRWLIANPKADAALLEYVAQAGGPGVARGFEVLFESME